MNESDPTRCIAFAGARRIASGDLRQVALKAKAAMDRDKWAQVLIFDEVTSNLIEVDFRGTADDVLHRIAEMNGASNNESAESEGGALRRPGRPKLGVVAREITLLPRHWDWLAKQAGGASVAIRKLVEEARRSSEDRDCVRQSQEAAYRFMSAMAGNFPGFEEATRALFAADAGRFD